MRVIQKYRHEFKSIEDARAYLRRRQVEDYSVLAGSDYFRFDGDLVQLGSGTYPMSQGFLQAFCQYTTPRIPIGFARAIPADLFEQVANRLMRHHEMKGKSLVARIEHWDELGHEWAWALALVTEGYKFIDHERVLDALLAAGVTGEANVLLTDRLLRITVATIPFFVKVNGHMDEFRYGVEVLNSENRFYEISVASYLCRLVCKNGMVMRLPGGLKFRHRHVIEPLRALTEMREILSPSALVWHEAAGVVQQRLQHLVGLSVEGPWLRMQQAALAAAIGTKASEEAFASYSASRPGNALSEFDVMNLMAQAGRQIEDPDKRRALEVYAGDLIWK